MLKNFAVVAKAIELLVVKERTSATVEIGSHCSGTRKDAVATLTINLVQSFTVGGIRITNSSSMALNLVSLPFKEEILQDQV